MPQPIVHFEIMGQDPVKLQKFYADLFGWKIAEGAAELGYYGLVDGATTDVARRNQCGDAGQAQASAGGETGPADADTESVTIRSTIRPVSSIIANPSASSTGAWPSRNTPAPR